MGGWVTVELPNGKKWGFTHCELVIPHGSLEGLRPDEILRTMLALSRRAAKWEHLICYGPSFDSLEAFDAACAEIEAEQNTRAARTVRVADLRAEIRRNYAHLFVLIGRRDGFACKGCGAATSDLEIDHVTPVSTDGDNDESNLQLLCKKCNTRKSNKIESNEPRASIEPGPD